MDYATHSMEQRDESNKQLLEVARQAANADAVLLTTTLPRGGLQLHGHDRRAGLGAALRRRIWRALRQAGR